MCGNNATFYEQNVMCGNNVQNHAPFRTKRTKRQREW